MKIITAVILLVVLVILFIAFVCFSEKIEQKAFDNAEEKSYEGTVKSKSLYPYVRVYNYGIIPGLVTVDCSDGKRRTFELSSGAMYNNLQKGMNVRLTIKINRIISYEEI